MRDMPRLTLWWEQRGGVILKRGGRPPPCPLSWTGDVRLIKKALPSFVRLPRALLRGDRFRVVGYPAKYLYLIMKDSLFDPDDGNKNKSEYAVKFGPRDAEGYGMWKATYYRALAELLDAGIIREVRRGYHGTKGVYDLSAWERY